MSTEVVLALVVAVAGSSVLSMVVTRWADRRKTKAEATDIVTEAASRALDMMTKAQQEAEKAHRSEMARLETRVASEMQVMRQRIDSQSQRIAHLEGLVAAYQAHFGPLPSGSDGG